MTDQALSPGANNDDAKPRLLVVEDDTLHRMMICRVAATAGYVPAGAASYDEAARLLGKGPFACITLDLTLGLRTGADVLGHLATIGSTAHIIIISVRDEADCASSVALARSLKLNILDAMRKPIDPAALRARLEALRSADAVAPAAA